MKKVGKPRGRLRDEHTSGLAKRFIQENNRLEIAKP